ncbi:hypothetical protein [Heyndrickxia coagulans]|nr:hypothetical protein [Heyndrickxia coagulans]MED4964303.1 hypothetical protein [Heyndrickxia coagulans]
MGNQKNNNQKNNSQQNKNNIAEDEKIRQVPLFMLSIKGWKRQKMWR